MQNYAAKISAKKLSSIIECCPLIDLLPTDPSSAILTFMLEAKRKTESTGLAVTVFPAGQKLYRVVVNITWVYPPLLERFIARLRGTHTLMSFVGCIGFVMANTD